MYNEKEIYAVIYKSGSCGAFIMSIIHNLLADHVIPLTLGENAEVHNNINVYTDNWTATTDYICLQNNVIPYMIPKEYIINDNRPWICMDHTKPNLSEVFTSKPNCKLIVIEVCPKDAWLLEFLGLLKHSGAIPHKWKNMPWFISDDIEDYDANAFKSYFEHIDIFNTFGSTYYFSQLEYESYQDKIFKINFFDIIFNMKNVLDILELVTNKKTNENTLENYRKYVNAHLDRFDVYLSWMNLREKAQIC